MRRSTRWHTTKSKSEAGAQLSDLMNSPYRLCGALAVGRRVGPGIKEYARLRCKRWGCPRCGPWMLKRFRQAVADAVEIHELTHFVSLTVSTGDGRNLPKLWSAFLDRVKQKYGRRPQYVWVFGRHRSGQLHLHAVIDMPIETSWGARAWREVGGGSNLSRGFHIRDVEDEWAAKYISKDVLSVAVTRRYGCSKSIKLGIRERKGEGDGWRRCPTTFKAIHEASADRVVWENTSALGFVNHFAVHDGVLSEALTQSEAQTPVSTAAFGVVGEATVHDAGHPRPPD